MGGDCGCQSGGTMSGDCGCGNTGEVVNQREWFDGYAEGSVIPQDNFVPQGSGTSNLGSGNLGSGNSGSGNSGTDSSGTDSSGTDSSGTGDSGTPETYRNDPRPAGGN